MDERQLVYKERNVCISVLVKMAIALGLRVGVVTDPQWPRVVVELPTGQVSWIVPAQEFSEFFPPMEEYPAGEWDRCSSKVRDWRLMTVRTPRKREET